METNFSKSEKVIAAVALVTISAFFALFLHVNRGTKAASQNEISINYEMARPDQVYSEYDLSGRELDQSYEALAKKAAKKAQEAKKTEDAKKKALIAKQKEANKKQAELKKKQQEAAQRTQFAKKQQQALQARAQAARQAVADTQVNREPQQSAYAGSGAYGANGGSPVAPVNDQQKQDAGKKTFAEWRSLLLASPTPENLAQFVAAFRNNEITSDEFQALAQDLLTQTDARYKALGLMALRSAPSLASLSQLVHLDAAAVGSYQSYVDQSVNAYLQTQNLPYLNQALRTSDKMLVIKVLNLLNVNLVKLNEGDTSVINDPRNRGGVSVFSMNNYLLLVPNLKLLASSPDAELASLAQQATSIIQSSNNVAQN